jgi:hypothetical protein
MLPIDWSLLNDAQFVRLVAGVLRRLGFVDIQIQGDGPDGGIDLFATELVNFAFQGSRPLRWGIQCKFSFDPGRQAVKPDEVQDVEGILRSDRYASQKPQGYLLITNKRVSQNVVERLQGLDRSSSFRASYLDGDQLLLHLHEQPELLDDYFGSRLQQIEAMAAEQLRDRLGEATGAAEFRYVRPDEAGIDSWEEVSDISGTYAFTEGVLELTHSTTSGEVEGRYQWHSDDFVGRLEGNLRRGVLQFRYRWLDGAHEGSGYMLISPDAERLEGMWLPNVDLESLAVEDLLAYGNRWSLRRVE